MPRELTRHQLSSRIAYDQSVPSFLRKLRNQVAGVSNNESDPELELDQEQEEDEFGRQRRTGERNNAILNENETRRRDKDREWDDWQASSGRPPIPRRPSIPSSGEHEDSYADRNKGSDRPPIPERPKDDSCSGDDDDDDERPQVVVLKEGKHLSAREVENEKRKLKGLPPFNDTSTNDDSDEAWHNSNTENRKSKHLKEETPSSSAPQAQTFASFGSGGPKHRSTTLKRKALTTKITGSDTAGVNTELSDIKANSTKQKEKRGMTKAKKQKTGLLSFGDDG